jgi:integrase
VWLAAGAGLREGEALGLTVPRVEFLARRLVVVEQMQNKVLSPLKTRASRRVVPADDLVLSAVTAHMQRWQPGPGHVLITNRLGGPVQRNSFGFCWREAVKAAWLQEGTRFHDLRHFYASTLIAAGGAPEGDPGAARARNDRRDDGHLRAPVPRCQRAGPRRAGCDVRPR